MAWSLEGEYFENCNCKVVCPCEASIANIAHPMGSSLPLAKSLEGRYDDPDWGLSFDNTGKNGNYRDFAWAA
jgi:hypothetical protein